MGCYLNDLGSAYPDELMIFCRIVLLAGRICLSSCEIMFTQEPACSDRSYYPPYWNFERDDRLGGHNPTTPAHSALTSGSLSLVIAFLIATSGIDEAQMHRPEHIET